MYIYRRFGGLSEVIVKKPVTVTFFVSLFLSLWATMTAVTVGKDGALYLDTSLTFIEYGWEAAYQQFNWPWFSIFLGFLHQLTHIPLELLAYGVCALFMAGACALIVKIVAYKAPGMEWWACLVVLAVPAFNGFRGEILREFGYWFFCILALTLCVSWDERRGWIRAGAIYISVIAAALFRFEALFLVLTVYAWQLFSIRGWRDFRRASWLLGYPFFGLLLALVLYFSIAEAANISRIQSFLMLLHPGALFESFQQMASQFADSMAYKHSRDEAGQIVFFGIIGTLMLEFLKSLGPFAILFMNKCFPRYIRGAWELFKPFGWACFFYFVVLMLFFWQKQYVNGRYASMLAWLAVPFIAALTMRFAQHYPKLGRVLVALGLLLMLANVVSLSPKKTHYKEAAFWVEQHVEATAQVYFEDSRMAYYAGWKVPRSTYPVAYALTRAAHQFDYFVLTSAADDPRLRDFISRESVKEIMSFQNGAGEIVTVFARKAVLVNLD